MGDIRTTTGEKPPESQQERRRKALRRVGAAVLVLGAIAGIGFAIRVPRYARAAGYATTVGYAEVRAATAGRVAEIVATSGHTVAKGDVLVRLDDETERAAVAEAEGQVADAAGHVAEARGDVERGAAELALREAAAQEALRLYGVALQEAELTVSQTQSRLDRTRQLHEKGLASGSKLAEDTFSAEAAKIRLSSLRAQDTSLEGKQLAVLAREVESRRNTLARAEAALSRAEAALARAKAALADRVVTAPTAGRVVRYTFYEGEMIRPDMVLYEVFDGEVSLLKLRVPEQYAGKVRPGMPLDATLGTYRTLLPTRFPGKVEVLRDVVEGTGDNFYRVAYCSLDRRGLDVAPGTSASARILYGRSNLWLYLLQP